MENQTQEIIGNEQIIIPKQEPQLEPLAKAGLIISLVLVSLTIVSSFFTMIWASVGGGIAMLVWAIVVLTIDIIALKEKTYSIVLAAGIVSLLFTSMLGGIFILCALPKKE